MTTTAPLSDIDAIVLCGGRGTRLAPVIGQAQKVTAMVSGEPFLLRLLHWLRAAGSRRCVLALGYRAEEVKASVLAAATGLDLTFSAEPRPLGTGGALRRALDCTSSDPILALNGDSFADVSLPELIGFHRRRAARATIALVPVLGSERYGTVRTAEDGRVLEFAEKTAARAAGKTWINAGIYVLDRSVLAELPPDRTVSIEREVFPMLADGLYGCQFAAPFIDIGTPESFAAAQSFFPLPGRRP